MTDAPTIAVTELSREELVARLRGLRPLFERAGVTHMTLFGSRARGDNRPDSDVDLVIDVAPSVRFSLLDVVGVGHLVDDHVGLKGDVLMHRGLKPHLVAEARNDGVVIF